MADHALNSDFSHFTRAKKKMASDLICSSSKKNVKKPFQRSFSQHDANLLARFHHNTLLVQMQGDLQVREHKANPGLSAQAARSLTRTQHSRCSPWAGTLPAFWDSWGMIHSSIGVAGRTDPKPRPGRRSRVAALWSTNNKAQGGDRLV